jgi:hypothetical protein
MDTYTLEQVGNPNIRFEADIDDPDTDHWTATPNSRPFYRSNTLLLLRIVNGDRAGQIAVGITSHNGQVCGRRAFTPD